MKDGDLCISKLTTPLKKSVEETTAYADPLQRCIDSIFDNVDTVSKLIYTIIEEI